MAAGVFMIRRINKKITHCFRKTIKPGGILASYTKELINVKTART